jgi:formate dehydrogenase iron-sulfur subunit
VEIGLGVVVPMVLFLHPVVRRERNWLLLAGTLVVGGIIVNRLNVGIIGLSNPAGEAYVPSWIEFLLTFGVTALGVLGYSIVAKFMPLFHEETPTQSSPAAA